MIDSDQRRLHYGWHIVWSGTLGIFACLGLGRFALGMLLPAMGEVLNLSYFEHEFEGTFKTAVEIREEITARNWEKVVAFQTRNPMHLAHEELCRMAKDRLGADGIVIHMLLGKLKAGDIPADVRDACIRKMVDLYFPENLHSLPD